MTDGNETHCMRHAWLHRAGSDRLLVFFAGWGMDPHPFQFLHAPGVDVLMLFDYRHTALPADFERTLATYTERTLLAWSLGVAVAQLRCREHAERFRARVALNGTVRPVHPELGIVPEIFDGTIAHLDGKGLARFIRRTCVTPEVHARYMLHPSQRPLGELREELVALRRIETPGACIFTHALAGHDDRIFPYPNQVRCWERFNVPYETIEAPHFPFYRWRSWTEVLNACNAGE